MPSLIWQCAEPACTRQVEYGCHDRESIAIPRRSAPVQAPVYMTCGQGHTHAYTPEPAASASL